MIAHRHPSLPEHEIAWQERVHPIHLIRHIEFPAIDERLQSFIRVSPTDGYVELQILDRRKSFRANMGAYQGTFGTALGNTFQTQGAHSSCCNRQQSSCGCSYIMIKTMTATTTEPVSLVLTGCISYYEIDEVMCGDSIRLSVGRDQKLPN